jgi:hypothetical protein
MAYTRPAAREKPERPKSAFGGPLRQWRVRRGLSQLALAAEAEISAPLELYGNGTRPTESGHGAPLGSGALPASR